MPDLDSIAFPVLSDQQIAELAECSGASYRRFEDGTLLFRAGDHNPSFYVVKAGQIEIVDCTGDARRTLAVHSKGSFTGDITNITGGAVPVSAVAGGQLEALEVSGDALTHALNRCPLISDLILQAFIARRQLLRDSPEFTGLRLIGSRYSADTTRLREFLIKNRALFTWLDTETEPEVAATLKRFGISEADTPVVACGSKLLLRNPSNRELADRIGVHQSPEQIVYDLAIVGAGPAGLAAAVYAASEGLSTIVIEAEAPGGQSSNSMRIENYLGFPTGITGSELTERAIVQATKFDARFVVPGVVCSLTFEEGYPRLGLADGDVVVSRTLLIAAGAEYRRLEVDGCRQYEGRGVYYAAMRS
ncbi:MAG TPA: FAD-dependent oxidoreductase, partial [Chthonomonadales bacterium]|nr:FAD-dependent oxidoreductase [Chthonomonadales bacterium]